MTQYGRLYYQIIEKASMLQAIKKTVIIEMIQRENATESGLILSGVNRDIPEARIVSVGPEVDVDLAVGNRVVVDWARVGRMDYEDRVLYVTGQSNIIGVFED